MLNTTLLPLAPPSPETRSAVIIVDYSEKSSDFLKNFIEARKILELDSLISVTYHVINAPAVRTPIPADEYPLLYVDGKLVSKGSVPSVDELVSLLLEPQSLEAGEKKLSLLDSLHEPPWFGAAEIVGDLGAS